MTPEPIVRLHDLTAFERFEHEAMATRFTLHLWVADEGTALRPIAEEAFRLLDRLEEHLSFYQEGSDITRINRAAEGEIIRIDEITHRCLLTAIPVSAASNAAFDPFAGHAALVAKDQSTPLHLADLEPPAPDDTNPVLALDPEQPLVTKLSGRRWLDLGAIGKGAALDAMADLLREWDVTSAVLNGGGSSILVFGQHPTGAEDEWDVSLPQTSGQPKIWLKAPFALSASGEGFQPGHIIGTSMRPQALVLAPNAAEADALSTAALLLSDKALDTLIEKDPRYGLIATNVENPAITAGVFSEGLRLPPPALSLIIPCWCESERLPPFLLPLAERINADNLPIEIIVVDDGSPQAEADALRNKVAAIHRQFPQVRPMETANDHRGKGGAIYHGWGIAHPESQWLAFVDADGAVPVDAVITGVTHAFSASSPLPVIAANRYHRDRSQKVQRGWIRQRTGGWFASWARKQLKLDTIDSQCGFKIVPAEWWRGHQEAWIEQGYAFDLELLLAAQDAGLRVKNFNIAWREVGGSNVGPGDGLKLVQTVKALRKKRGD